MEIDQKRQIKRSQVYKEIMAPENKENFNTENSLLNNELKKPHLKPTKPLYTNTRYFETQAEKMGLVRKEFEKCTENPEKKPSSITLENLEPKKAKTVRGNMAKTELNPNDTEKNASEICADLELKEDKSKNAIAKIKKNEKAEKKNYAAYDGAAAQSENFSLNTNNLTNTNNKYFKNPNELAAMMQGNLGIETNKNNENDFKANEDANILVTENAQQTNKVREESLIITEHNNNKTINNNNNKKKKLCNLNNSNNNVNNNNNQALNKNAITNKDAIIKANIPPVKKVTTMEDYLEKENVIIIRNYGTEIYHYMRSIEHIGIPSNFMEKHKINPDIRTKMVDWVVEVLSVYKCEQETYFLSVYIMDSYIFKSPAIITTDEIHIIGLTAMFVASKFEDMIPIRMSSLVSKIGHDLFTAQQVTKLERKMLEIVEFDKLIISSIYEFIRTFFYDFRFNNRKYISKLKMEEEIKDLEKCSILFAKLMFYASFFYNYDFSLKAITCIISAFDTLRNAGKFINVESESFFREWIMFLIEESSYTDEQINEVYVYIMKYHADYDKIPLISHNLNKFPN